MTNRSNDQQPSLFDDAEIVTMLVVDEPVRRETPITAAELRAGDIVLKRNGDRDYAAFDVDVTDDAVHVWTATTDQAKGLPRDFYLGPDENLVVARKTSTRIAVR